MPVADTNYRFVYTDIGSVRRLWFYCFRGSTLWITIHNNMLELLAQLNQRDGRFIQFINK
jgi:hypothetical protein